jgi:hypothetical protein
MPNRNRRDGVWACVSASVLAAAALFVVLVLRPGGFEGQIGWFLTLLPGAIAGVPVSDRLYKMSSSLSAIGLWTTTVSLSFLWYFVLSYLAIKIYRAAAGLLNPKL